MAREFHVSPAALEEMPAVEIDELLMLHSRVMKLTNGVSDG